MMMAGDKDVELIVHGNKIYDPIKIGSIDGTDVEPHDRAIARALFSEYVPNKQVRGDPRHTLFVARLNPRTTQDTIKAEFAKCGKIVSCRLVKDIVTGKSKKYAFVEYESSMNMERAHRHMHKEIIDGAEILVEREAERSLHGWKPRRLGGGFGGRRESGQLRFGCRERPFRKPINISLKKESDKRYAAVRYLINSLNSTQVYCEKHVLNRSQSIYCLMSLLLSAACAVVLILNVIIWRLNLHVRSNLKVTYLI